MKRGTYALVAFLKKGVRIQIGRLGMHDFTEGYYIYAGSALGSLSGRLNRHLKQQKRLHWHIDYLLQHASIKEIWYTEGLDRLECTWNAIITALPGAQLSIRGFGSSDCRCFSHLTYFIAEPSFAGFEHQIVQNGLPQVRHYSSEQ
jgi:Uri superfamily endonuclease